MYKTKKYYINLFVAVAIALSAISGTGYLIYKAHKRYELVNQETLAAKRFKNSAAYHKQQGMLEAYAGIIKTVGKLSYNPAFVPPPRKPR